MLKIEEEAAKLITNEVSDDEQNYSVTYRLFSTIVAIAFISHSSAQSHILSPPLSQITFDATCYFFSLLYTTLVL